MTAFGSLTRGGSGRFSLGELERRASGVTLKYPSIENTNFDNTCFNTGLTVFRRVLEQELQQKQANVVYFRRMYASIEASWNAWVTAGDEAAAKRKVEEYKAQYQDELNVLRNLRDLKAQFELEVKRNKLPERTPVCFAQTDYIRAHEQVHAYLNLMLGFGKAPGQTPTKSERIVRDNIFDPVYEKFFFDLGPAGTAFYKKYSTQMQVGALEEILSGLVGAAVMTVIARQTQMPKHKFTPEWRGVVNAFAGYIPGVSPVALSTDLVQVVAEFEVKYGGNVDKAMRAVRKAYKEIYE